MMNGILKNELAFNGFVVSDCEYSPCDDRVDADCTIVNRGCYIFWSQQCSRWVGYEHGQSILILTRSLSDRRLIPAWIHRLRKP